MINIDLNEIKDRLTSECASFGGRVFVAFPPDDDLAIEQHESPVAFVYSTQEDSGDNNVMRMVRQKVDAIITVEIIVRRTATADDRYGEADLEIMTLARREVFAALQGYSPMGAVEPFKHRTGQAKGFNKDTARWTDTFICQTQNMGGIY